MTRTLDHLVDVHRLARERVAAGLLVWDRKLDVSDVFHNDALTFEQRRDSIVRKIRNSGWLDGRDMFDDLVLAVEGLENADDVDEFDGWWDEVYDHADYDRAWISTHPRV